MGRGPKPAKGKAKPADSRKSPKNEDSKVRGLEKRLAEAREEQAATAEILRVISQSPGNVQPVFDAIVAASMRLCQSVISVVTRYDGELLHLAAHSHQGVPEAVAMVQQLFPTRPYRALLHGRVVLDGTVVHLPDVQADTEYRQAIATAFRARSALGVPLLLDGRVIGVIAIARTELRPFTDAEIALLRTFADQAVIGIENVRLFNETKEALEQQTATSDVLKVISSSPTNTQPVFDAIAESAARLCDAIDAQVLRVEGEVLRLVAACGATAMPSVRQLTRGHLVGRAVIDRRTIHVRDLAQALAEYPETTAGRYGTQSALAVPLVREGLALGVIRVSRTEIRPFTDKQIALLQTFADQAVIAIENVRLFNDTKEALDRQTATAEILRVISQSQTEVQPVFDAIVASAVRLCDGLFGTLWQFDGELIHQVAQQNYTAEALEEMRRVYPCRPSRAHGSARAILERAVVHIPDNELDPEFRVQALSRAVGWRSGLFVPMLREGAPIGALAVSRARPGPFSGNEIELLKTFADQAVIAIENVRLFNETKEALDRQTATSEILRVISSSPTDVQPVFDAIAEAAARLCEAFDAAIFHLEGERLRLVAHHGPIPTVGPVGQFTIPLVRGIAVGRSVLDGRSIHVADIETEAEEFPEGNEQLRRMGVRTILSVPLMREGVAIGAIGLRRTEVRPFTDQQISLLQTFADQAVIAIENVRLFTELQTSNRDLTTALDTQTATSDILRVISRSQTDVQPVFEAIVHSAVRLLRAYSGALTRVDREEIALAALTSTDDATGDAAQRARYPQPLNSESAHAQTIRDRAPLNVADAHTDHRVSEAGRVNARIRGYQSILVVPMLLRDAAVGAISVTRRESGGFNNDEIALLQTFADQAVIAIENVRLFTELQEKNRALADAHAQVSEALEQQTATSEILRVISSSPTDLQPVLDTVAERAASLCGAFDGGIFRVDGARLRLVALHASISGGPAGGRVGEFTIPLTHGTVAGRAVLERRSIHVTDLQKEIDEFPEGSALARRLGHRTTLSVPLLREGVGIGCIQIRRSEVQPFTQKQVELLLSFADQAVIAIENVRLFTELQEKNQALTQAHAQVTEALEQQTATSEILRVISRSPTDTQPVFDAIARNAVALCGGIAALVLRYDGEMLHIAGHHEMSPDAVERVARAFPRRPGRDYPPGRALLERQVVHIPDLQAATEFTASAARQRGVGSMLVVPLLREGEAIGVISLGRDVVGRFSAQQIEVLQTFADQAVIAIENVRLFKELQARTQQLTRSVEQLTALGDVGRAVSSSVDLETVLNTIVARAVQLAGAHSGTIWEYDAAAEEFVLRITQNVEDPELRANSNARVRRGEGAVGRLAISQRPVQIPDITDEGAYEGRLRDSLVGAGARALLAIPLLHEDQLLGGLVISRRTPGEFPSEVVDLLASFATQSALALQNARLFLEIEDKSRQLETASQHKSEFLANMSHELRTPLNAIIGFSEVLSEKMFGELNEKQEEYSKDIHASGQHLLSLINDILDLSKIEAGRMELELSDFDLPTALDNALMLVRERAGRRSITLQMSVDERLGEVRADERKIRQVVLNLLSNAIKFTPEGGRIEVAAVPQDGLVEVSVSDTGVGIATEDQDAIFEEFRQVGTADKKAEGTGLGLTLCRKFIELHGGRIWVKSQIGEGSTFTFAIPVHHGE
jgi:GAF domain-containing protein